MAPPANSSVPSRCSRSSRPCGWPSKSSRTPCPELADPGEEQLLREDVLRYSREIAFAAAGVYASAAEERGAWDARLEALLVDALLSGEPEDALLSRAAAVGWRQPEVVAVVIGPTPAQEPEAVVDQAHDVARTAGLDVLAGVHAERLVLVAGGTSEPVRMAGALLPVFGDGPVIVGPAVAHLRTRPGPRWPRSPARPPSAHGRGLPVRCPPTPCCRSGRWQATTKRGADSWRKPTKPCAAPGMR